MRSLLQQYYTINQAAGLEFFIRKDGSVSIAGCQVMVKDKQLYFEKKFPDLKSPEDIAKKFDAKLPVAINLSGRGVLHRRMEKVEEISQANFSAVLPNANIDDFYVQHFVSGGYSFVSVIRKTDADKWINYVKAQNLIPLMLCLGPYPVQHILQQLNVYGDEVIFNGNKITLDEQSNWAVCQHDESYTSPFVLKIENEQVDQRLLIPYAAAFQLVLASKLEAIKAPVPDIELNFEQILNAKKLKMSGFLVLSAVFILLLANFLIFSSLNTSNNRLTEQVSQSAKSTSDLQDINDRIKEKEALLQNLGWDGGLSKSVMTDQLSALLPAGLQLQQIAINPPDVTDNHSQNALQFFDKRIDIQGLSAQIIPVNEWIARLKTKKWVKGIQLESYNYNNELNTGQFFIRIDY